MSSVPTSAVQGADVEDAWHPPVIRISVEEAASRLGELIDAAHRGELVYILIDTDQGLQQVLLAPIGRKTAKPAERGNRDRLDSPNRSTDPDSATRTA